MSFEGVNTSLAEIERRVHDDILNALTSPKLDSNACDEIFGIYTHKYLAPCVSSGLSARAATFSRGWLIPAVLDLEKRLSTRFHKGALFYDTGVAHLLSGDENGYELFLAMSDEEDFRKTHGAHKRGTLNLRNDGLAAPTITGRMQFASNLLNGKVVGSAADFAFMTDRWLQMFSSRTATSTATGTPRNGVQ